MHPSKAAAAASAKERCAQNELIKQWGLLWMPERLADIILLVDNKQTTTTPNSSCKPNEEKIYNRLSLEVSLLRRLATISQCVHPQHWSVIWLALQKHTGLSKHQLLIN